MKTPRTLQDYFEKRDVELEKLRKLRAAIHALENTDLIKSADLAVKVLEEALDKTLGK